MLDDIDRRILRRWQAEPDLAPAALATDIGINRATVSRRVNRMADQGIVRGVRAEVNWSALGYEVEVSLRVTLDKTQASAFDDFIEGAREIPEVLAIQTFLGRVDVRLSMIARDMAHYQHIYRTRVLTLPHIADIEALMHVARVQNKTALPV